MKLARSDRGWMSGVASEDVVAIDDPRLKRPTATVTDAREVAELLERMTSRGYVARVIQHEIDHLDAIEFVDRMTSMDSLTTVRNYLRHHRSA